MEWITRIAQAMNWKGRIIFLPNDGLPPHLRATFNWNYEFGMDAQKLRTVIGYTEPVNLDLAMKNTIEWESQNPPATLNPLDTFDYAAEDKVSQSRS